VNQGSEILNRLLSSEVKGDLLVLFRKNPGIIDTTDGVARRIGRKGSSIENDVKDLVGLGILKIKHLGSREAISLNRQRDGEVQELVGNYLRSLKKE
jgi:hypothetical protein